MSERHRAHLFGRRNARPNGSHPGAKEPPDGFGLDGGQELHQPLGDQAQLDVGVIGAHFAQDVFSVCRGLPVKVLISADRRNGVMAAIQNRYV